MGILETLTSKVPRWMITVPRASYQLLMSGPAGMLSAMGEALYQARFAALPGQVRAPGIPGLGGFDSIDALFLIARDRLVIPAQGLSGIPWVIEKPWDLALRLRRWRDDWVNNVGAFGLLDQMAAALAPNFVRLRLVQSLPAVSLTSWFTRETDGTRILQRSDGCGWSLTPGGLLTPDTTAAVQWDWDSLSIPVAADRSDPSRSWIIAYAPCAPYMTADDGTFNDPGVVDDAYNDPTAQVNGQPFAGTVGTNSPAGFVALVQNFAEQRRTAGAKTVRWIVAYDPASFNPDGTSTAGASRAAYPDGFWGWHSTAGTVGGQPTRIIARLQTAEYWQLTDVVPPPGS